MKFKKMSVVVSSLALSLTILIGCSNTSSENTKKESKHEKTESYKNNQTAAVDGLEITFDKVQMLKAEDEKSEVVHVHFTLKNTTAEKKGFSAIELEVKNSNNQALEVYPGENYGKEISGGGSDSGSGYFTSQGSGPYTVSYTDAATKKVINWKLNLDK